MLDVQPARMSLVNLVSGEQLDAQFNPEELQETIGAVYAKQVVPGLSHQVKQFVHTEDLSIAFTLFWSGHVGVERHALNQRARAFLHAACHPRTTNAGSIGRGGAPRLLFVWPELFSLTCVLTKASFAHRQFNARGASVNFSCAVTLEELRDAFLASEDVIELGTRRPAGRVGPTFGVRS